MSPRTDPTRVAASTPERTGPGIVPAGRGRRPIAARRAAAAAVAGTSPAVGADLDDAGLPLLTPTDDVPDESDGLPIVVDLGPQPPLLSPSARPPWSRRTDSRRPGCSASARDGPRGETGAVRPSSARIAWSLAAIVLAAAILGLLAFFGRLGWFGGRPSSPADRTPAKPRVVEQPREPHRPGRRRPSSSAPTSSRPRRE